MRIDELHLGDVTALRRLAAFEVDVLDVLMMALVVGTAAFELKAGRDAAIALVYLRAARIDDGDVDVGRAVAPRDREPPGASA